MEGDIVPGKTLTWTPKPGLTFGWRIDELNPDVSIGRQWKVRAIPSART